MNNKKRRSSTTEVYGSELKEDDLHFMAIKNQATDNQEQYKYLEQDYQLIKVMNNLLIYLHYTGSVW
jgi:hypothetical protein